MKFRFPSLIIAVMLVTACQGPSDATGLSSGEMDPASPAPFLTGIPTSIGNDRSASLGETVRYDNGVEITMTSLGWHPTNSGEPGAIEGQLAEFEITVFNGGKEPFNAGLLSAPIVTYGRDNTPTNVARDQSYKPVRSYFGVIPVGEKHSIHVNRGLPSAAAGEVQVQLVGPDYGKLFFKGALSSHKMYWDGTTVK